MKTYDVQSAEIRSPFARAFDYIADPSTLPEWTHAFAAIRGRRAVMRTPVGEADVDLEVQALRESGTIDWTMTFPGGEVARAWSRVVPHGDDRVIYVFAMPAPPVPMERLEARSPSSPGSCPASSRPSAGCASRRPKTPHIWCLSVHPARDSCRRSSRSSL